MFNCNRRDGQYRIGKHTRQVRTPPFFICKSAMQIHTHIQPRSNLHLIIGTNTVTRIGSVLDDSRVISIIERDERLDLLCSSRSRKIVIHRIGCTENTVVPARIWPKNGIVVRMFFPQLNVLVTVYLTLFGVFRRFVNQFHPLHAIAHKRHQMTHLLGRIICIVVDGKLPSLALFGRNQYNAVGSTGTINR